jgi:CheY-like chemotaxis protein
MTPQGTDESHGPGRLATEMDKRKIVILMADDDEDDCFLFQEALEESSLDHDLRCFANGQDLMDHLRRLGEREELDVPWPDLIILDLNMPIKDGRTALQEIKNDSVLKNIHVMVLTESRKAADVTLSYNLGVETFLTKEEWFKILMEVVKTSGDYWFSLVCPELRRIGDGHVRAS